MPQKWFVTPEEMRERAEQQKAAREAARKDARLARIIWSITILAAIATIAIAILVIQCL